MIRGGKSKIGQYCEANLFSPFLELRKNGCKRISSANFSGCNLFNNFKLQIKIILVILFFLGGGRIYSRLLVDDKKLIIFQRNILCFCYFDCEHKIKKMSIKSFEVETFRRKSFSSLVV